MLSPKILIYATSIMMAIVIFIAWKNTLHRPDIRGNWISSACETLTSPTGDKASLEQRLQLTDHEWVLEQIYFSDINCQNKTYRLQTVGVYELGDKSTEILGATHGEFTRRELYLTAFAKEAAQVFEQYQCGDTKWETDTTTFISKTGCTGIAQSVSACPREYNIVKRENNLLYLGDRSESLCEQNRYPKILNTTPLQILL